MTSKFPFEITIWPLSEAMNEWAKNWPTREHMGQYLLGFFKYSQIWSPLVTNFLALRVWEVVLREVFGMTNILNEIWISCRNLRKLLAFKRFSCVSWTGGLGSTNHGDKRSLSTRGLPGNYLNISYFWHFLLLFVCFQFRSDCAKMAAGSLSYSTTFCHVIKNATSFTHR